MKRHQSYTDIATDDRGAAVAIGNFDGVHLGHQSVIALARAAAAELNCATGIVTFEPHPRSLFSPDAAPFRLMDATAKAHRLEKLGIGQLYEVPFTRDLAGLTAEEFVTNVLIDGIGVRHVVVGADFRFGKGRAGDTEFLKDAGARHGFGVTIAPLISDQTGDVSSTAIRNALAQGRPEEAARMLGHWHRIDGYVDHGEKRGRELGFPTANIAMPDLHPPKFGIYAVQFEIFDGPHTGSYLGAASVGVRPTFDGDVPNIETYIFDFAGDIYGAEVSVALVAYLRAEKKFDDLDALVAQMNRDCDQARSILAERLDKAG